MKCKQCGAEIENSRCCPYCGSENTDYDVAMDAVQQEAVRQKKTEQGKGREIHDSDKSKMVTFLLYMVTMGFFMLGWFYDLFMIATNKFKDANGDYIVR